MSSTPPNRPVGRTPPGGPNGPFMKMRRPKPADPLVRPKRRTVPRPPAQGQGAATPSLNGQPRPFPAKPQVNPRVQPKPQQQIKPSADDLTVNGFSGPALSENCIDYPLVTTKRALREGLRHHVAKFVSKKMIDPRDETQFPRPARLQRRDPRATAPTPASGDGEASDRKGNRDPATGLDEAEREQLEEKKAAREKEREENRAQIAPSISTGQKRTNAPKQRTQQVFKSEMTPEEIARARIKYEEALPWHLEDFDNKNTWSGKYEAAMSDTYVMFVLENTGKMRMVPIDKWYKFTPKNQFKTLTIEEVEKHMARKIRDPRWFMEKEQAQAQEKELQKYAKSRKLFTGRAPPATGGREGFEGDEMDFEEDRFADDEEHVGLFDEDEDAKTAEKRIKDDQLKANIFNIRDEKVYEEEEQKEKKEKEALKHFGKHVRKALQRREKNFDYSSGSDANPYSEESTDESEEERQREEQRKAEEEQKGKEKESDKPSAASTKGTNTPLERNKPTDALKKAAMRKRPGSPNLSDASGTDTSRKRPKNKHASPQPPSNLPQGQRKTATTSPPSGGAGDVPKASQQPAGGKKRIRNGPNRAGSGSDGERGAGSAAEMTDSAVPKKLKINPPGVRSKTGTPSGSRAASPKPGAGGSRAGSPDVGRVNSPTTATNTGAGFPTAAEIHAAIPATGILSNDLLRIFRSRLGNSRENQRKFIGIVKNVSVFGKEDKLLRPGALK